MTKDQFDKEVQAHVSRFIRDADAKEDARIAQKKLVKHRAKAAKTNSLNRSSMSTLLSPKDAGTKIAESIITSIETKHTTTLSEGGSKAFLDAKAKLKEVGMHIHKTGFGDVRRNPEYRVVHHSEKNDADKGHFTDDLEDALHTGLTIANSDKNRAAFKKMHESSADDDVWCKTCHGEGKNGVKPIDSETGNPDYFEGRCLDCNGTGKRQAKTNQASQN